MKAANLNHLWGRLIFAELTRLGVRQVFISPGSRSTPLTIAAAEADDINTTSHFDERGAAFAALGYAKACGRPAALVCTSGTALVNYYPAIVEASLSNTPLLILSADRPEELRHRGAPQTIDQVDIFGRYLRWFADLPSPAPEVAPNWLLDRVDQAFASATKSPAGPVQLNCQFREPLAPLEQGKEWREYLAPLADWLEHSQLFTDGSGTTIPAPHGDVEAVAEKLNSSKHGVVITGPLPAYRGYDAIIQLAEKLRWPLLADISSGIRFGSESSSIMSHADLYLRDEAICDRLKPDLVLHFGGVPSSKAVLNYAGNAGAEYIQISEHHDPQDPLRAMTRRTQADPNRFAEELVSQVNNGNPQWLTHWRSAEQVVVEEIGKLTAGERLSEPLAANLVSMLAPDDAGLWLANSMPIRDCDAFALRRSRRLHVGSNRGANGIDGTVASAVGFASGLKKTTTLLLGDLALLHDLNSLALLRHSQLPVIVVVLNNNGGGIFHFLPIAKVETHFENYFGTPHGLGFEKAAQMFSLRYHRPTTHSQFEQYYRQMISAGDSGIIEVQTDRQQNTELHRKIWQDVAASVRGALQPA